MMRRARPLLGTYVEIAAAGAADDPVAAAIDAAFAAIARIQRLMSFHDPRSDVSRINDAEPEREIRIDPHTVRVLRLARELSERSNGAFDVTIAPVLVERGFLPPRPRETAPLGATYRDLELRPQNYVRWRRKGWIDLGGIAKGYAVDCAIAALRAGGATSGIVNAGGDLRCFGEARPIHVRHPAAATVLVPIGCLSNAALATSAGYFSISDEGGGHGDPLVDAKRGHCVRWDASVSVAAADAMTADALTKLVRLAPASAPDILAQFRAQAIVVDQTGARSCGRRLLHAAHAA